MRYPLDPPFPMVAHLEAAHLRSDIPRDLLDHTQLKIMTPAPYTHQIVCSASPMLNGILSLIRLLCNMSFHHILISDDLLPHNLPP